MRAGGAQKAARGGAPGGVCSGARRVPVDVDTLTFVGTATTVLRLGSFTLLTDPNFLHRGQRAYLGKGLWTKRLM